MKEDYNIILSRFFTYVGSGAGAFSAWLGEIDWAFWLSVVVGLGGLAINFYFSREKDLREKAEHALTLRKLRNDNKQNQ